jgi:hypothetical protein
MSLPGPAQEREPARGSLHCFPWFVTCCSDIPKRQGSFSAVQTLLSLRLSVCFYLRQPHLIKIGKALWDEESWILILVPLLETAVALSDDFCTVDRIHQAAKLSSRNLTPNFSREREWEREREREREVICCPYCHSSFEFTTLKFIDNSNTKISFPLHDPLILTAFIGGFLQIPCKSPSTLDGVTGSWCRQLQLSKMESVTCAFFWFSLDPRPLECCRYPSTTNYRTGSSLLQQKFVLTVLEGQKFDGGVREPYPSKAPGVSPGLFWDLLAPSIPWLVVV